MLFLLQCTLLKKSCFVQLSALIFKFFMRIQDLIRVRSQLRQYAIL